MRHRRDLSYVLTDPIFHVPGIDTFSVYHYQTNYLKGDKKVDTTVNPRGHPRGRSAMKSIEPGMRSSSCQREAVDLLWTADCRPRDLS